MFEENNGSEVKRTLATTEELLAEINRLTEKVTNLEAQRSFYVNESNEWREKWARAAMLFEASLEENGVDTDDLSENDRALVEMFGIEFTEEVEVTFTMKWSSTLTVKKGADLSDLEVESSLPYDLAVTLDGETHYLGNDYEEFDY